MARSNQGMLYILSNPSIGSGKLLKIGQTADDVEARAKALRTSGVPQDFVIEYQARVRDYESAEREVHEALTEYRISGDREFFNCTVEEAIAAIRAKRDILHEEYASIRTENISLAEEALTKNLAAEEEKEREAAEKAEKDKILEEAEKERVRLRQERKRKAISDLRQEHAKIHLRLKEIEKNTPFYRKVPEISHTDYEKLMLELWFCDDETIVEVMSEGNYLRKIEKFWNYRTYKNNRNVFELDPKKFIPAIGLYPNIGKWPKRAPMPEYLKNSEIYKFVLEHGPR